MRPAGEECFESGVHDQSGECCARSWKCCATYLLRLGVPREARGGKARTEDGCGKGGGMSWEIEVFNFYAYCPFW